MPCSEPAKASAPTTSQTALISVQPLSTVPPCGANSRSTAAAASPLSPMLRMTKVPAPSELSGDKAASVMAVGKKTSRTSAAKVMP